MRSNVRLRVKASGIGYFDYNLNCRKWPAKLSDLFCVGKGFSDYLCSIANKLNHEKDKHSLLGFHWLVRRFYVFDGHSKYHS